MKPEGPLAVSGHRRVQRRPLTSRDWVGLVSRALDFPHRDRPTLRVAHRVWLSREESVKEAL